MACPVEYTCPIIDSTISDLKEAANILDRVIYSLEDVVKDDIISELSSAIHLIASQYDGKSSNLELIRSANETIRRWGEEIEEARDELTCKSRII